MSLLQTPTPAYKKHGTSPTPAPEPARGILGWLSALLRTPTPDYKTAPPPGTSAANGDPPKDAE